MVATTVEIGLVALSFICLVAFVLLVAYRVYRILKAEMLRSWDQVKRLQDENAYLRDEVERLSAERGRR